MQEIARRRNGGGKTIDDVFDLAVASNRDAEERHLESVEAIRETRQLLADHCVEAEKRDARLCALEEWRSEVDARDVDSWHGRRIATGAVELEDEEMGDLRRAWRVLRWAVIAFLLPIIAQCGYRVAMFIFD